MLVCRSASTWSINEESGKAGSAADGDSDRNVKCMFSSKWASSIVLWPGDVTRCFIETYGTSSGTGSAFPLTMHIETSLMGVITSSANAALINKPTTLATLPLTINYRPMLFTCYYTSLRETITQWTTIVIQAINLHGKTVQKLCHTEATPGVDCLPQDGVVSVLWGFECDLLCWSWWLNSWNGDAPGLTASPKYIR